MDNKMTLEQMLHAQDAYHYAIAAAGGQVDGVESAVMGHNTLTRTQYIVAAWREVKAAGLPVKRPRGPVDGAPLARSILEFCQQRGIDANTGRPLEAQDDEGDEELEPEAPHRCRRAAGFCRTCLS